MWGNMGSLHNGNIDKTGRGGPAVLLVGCCLHFERVRDAALPEAGILCSSEERTGNESQSGG